MTEKKAEKYIEGIGRRKTASARVRIYPGSKSKSFEVNGKSLEDYFSTAEQKKTALAPFDVLDEKFKVTVQVKGGGLNAQGESIRHGLSWALVKHDEKWRKDLRGHGFLTRDPRMKESKKPGLKGARRAKQWRKR